MFLLRTLRQAVQSWTHRRSGGGSGVRKASKRVGVALERLDHRQLLAVNFTGNVITDFPVTEKPGVVDLPAPAGAEEAHFQPGSVLQQLAQQSGFAISDIRLSYSAADDILSVGLATFPNPKVPGQFVIAGDADNNGNAGQGDPAAPPSVDPAVSTATNGLFKDFQDLGGSEYMAAFLDLKGVGKPDIVAGVGTLPPADQFPNGTSGGSKLYHVARPEFDPNSGALQPFFGAALPDNTGRLYLNNDPTHPHMEFEIDHFSQLFLAETGKALTADAQIGVGVEAGSADDFASETFLPSQTARVGDFTVPPTVCPPTPAPPLTPPVIVNYHQSNRINTAHNDDVRVQIFGTGNFDVTQIDPASVHIGTASPRLNFYRRVPGDPYPERTFVFRGTDLNLPAGTTNVEVTGTLLDGEKFDSLSRVFNRNDSFYTPAEIAARNARLTAQGLTIPGAGATTAGVTAAAITVDYGTGNHAHATSAHKAAAPASASPSAQSHVTRRAATRQTAAPRRLGTRVADLKGQDMTAAPAGGA